VTAIRGTGSSRQKQRRSHRKGATHFLLGISVFMLTPMSGNAQTVQTWGCKELYTSLAQSLLSADRYFAFRGTSTGTQAGLRLLELAAERYDRGGDALDDCDKETKSRHRLVESIEYIVSVRLDRVKPLTIEESLRSAAIDLVPDSQETWTSAYGSYATLACKVRRLILSEFVDQHIEENDATKSLEALSDCEA
jgi:hypothetical protein